MHAGVTHLLVMVLAMQLFSYVGEEKNASIQLVACYNHPVPATAATKASYMHDLVPCLLNSSATLEDPLACFLLLLNAICY